MKPDPLAYASETPDIGALIQEFEYAQNTGPCRPEAIATAEDVRYNRWEGKSNPPDGLRRQKNAPNGVIVRPYDGRPDSDVQLTDEIIEYTVDLMVAAHQRAQLGATTTHVTQLTAAQSAELTAVARWVQQVIADDIEDDEELLAQMTATIGWAVLHPGWKERWELVERELDLEAFIVQIAQGFGPEAARQLYTAILDPNLETIAVQIVQQLFAYVPAPRVKTIVRELREEGRTNFLDKQLAEKRPCIRTLIPGYNYFVSGTAGKLEKARGHLVIERFYCADLEATAAANGWNPEFVEAVKSTAGKFSTYGEAMRDKSTVWNDGDDHSIEIWTTHVQQFDEEIGAAGIYCTTFSPHLKPGGNHPGGRAFGDTPKSWYAKHYLLGYSHGKAPFIESRLEVVGPALDDTRGVPEITRSNQKVIKDLQDAGIARTHLEVNPPRAFIGFGGTKTDDWNRPGASIPSMMPGADVRDLGPVKGSPREAEMAINRIENTTYRQFALPDAEVHPARWQPRQMRRARRALSPWQEAYWQLTVLCYQELDPAELTAIIGREPQLTVQDLLRHRITLTFDARTLDNDWTSLVLDYTIKLLGIDSGGLMDRGVIIDIALRNLDPTFVNLVMRSPAGAQAKLYDQVEQDVTSIILGNPPPMREMDASAGMQLQMAFAVLGKNDKYKQVAQRDPEVAKNLETYMKNLEHSAQQTQLSPVQGRLGVAAMPERPVQKGNSLETSY